MTLTLTLTLTLESSPKVKLFETYQLRKTSQNMLGYYAQGIIYGGTVLLIVWGNGAAWRRSALSECFSSYYWPPPGGICFCRRLSVCLFVCLSVCNITQKVMDQFWWNFQGLIATLRSGSDSFLKGLGQRSRSKSIKRSNSLKWL